MNRSIFVSLAILTLSTSVAFAAHKTHHSRAMKPNASATNPATPVPAGWPGGGMSNKDHEMYVKNQHESGMDKQKPK
jgi:hypothetical protein